MNRLEDIKILIKGAGDLATGVGLSLYKAGFDIYMSDLERPSTVRTSVAFSSAMIYKEKEVEGVKARLCKNFEDIQKAKKNLQIPVFVDLDKNFQKLIKPDIIIDAIIAKKNIDTKKEEAKLVIALGPGFYASKDCHIVVETNRGHELGKLIFFGEASKNTGIPKEIGGFSKKRVLRAEHEGVFKSVKKIGDIVKEGEVLAYIDDKEVLASINGLIRGMLFDSFKVTKGFKIGDIDPRLDVDYTTISDKSRALGRACLEAVMIYLNKRKKECI